MTAPSGCRWRTALCISWLLILVTRSVSPADPAKRGWHGMVQGGGALMLIGADGDRARFDLVIDVKPRSRYGLVLGWRGFDGSRDGLLLGGLVFEAASARPRLVIDLHGTVGADLDTRAAACAGGLRTTLAVMGPLGVALDLGSTLMLGGSDTVGFQLHASLFASLGW